MDLVEKKYEPENINELTNYDKFIIEKCDILSIARVSTADIIKQYVNWLTENNIKIEDESEIGADFRRHLTKQFLPTNGKFIYNGRPDCGGFWGITLKSNAEVIEGCYSKESNKKKIYKICPKTKQVVETFNSVAECSKVYGSVIYKKLKSKVAYKDYIFSYSPP